MNILRHSMLATGLSLLATGANAGLINLAGMANGATGESAWDTFTYADPDGFTLSITGWNSGGAAFAYLDRGTGGMGVCKSLNANGVLKKNQNTASGANLCSISSDDNTSSGEMLSLMFDKKVTIEKLVFNNFHDGDKNLNGDMIDIFGTPYLFTNGNANTPSFTTAPYVVGTGIAFNISFNNEPFYLQKMQVSYTPSIVGGTSFTVPVPAPLTLLGIGLAGLAWSRRRTI